MVFQCIAFELIQIAAWFMIGIRLLWNVDEDSCEYLTSNELVKKQGRENSACWGRDVNSTVTCLNLHGLKGQGGFFWYKSEFAMKFMHIAILVNKKEPN